MTLGLSKETRWGWGLGRNSGVRHVMHGASAYLRGSKILQQAREHAACLPAGVAVRSPVCLLQLLG